jgi:hypothetical protein
MNLEDFHKLVSFELKRGASLDSWIPLYVKQAVNFLERNAPLKYMEEWVTLKMEPNDQIVDFIWAFRNWKFLRYAQDTEWFYLQKRDPREELTPAGPTTPTKYSQIGVRYLRLNAPWRGPGNLLLEGIVYKFSDWQTTRPDFRHFLLEQASDLLLFQTMMRIGAGIRDNRLDPLYRPLRDEALKTFMGMDTDAEYDGSTDDTMVYGGIYS